MNKIKIIGVVFLALVSITMGANAQTIADVANSVKGNIQGIPKVISSICYIAGAVLGVQSALKLKEFNESKGQTKLFIPIAFFLGSALLLSLPSVMDVGMGTFGYTKTKTSKY